MSTILGSIYLPASPGTQVGRFAFIVDPETGGDVEIGTPVAADTQEGTVIGTVTDMSTIGLGRDPVSADLGSSYDDEFIASIPEVMLATVQVFHSHALRPVRAGKVRAATSEEMLLSTGFNNMSWPIPAGVVPMADGTLSRICFDGHALMGPDSGHCLIGGLSGQAAKTSFASTLLRSTIHAGTEDDSVGALIFNVKGEDLIYLDEPPAQGYELGPEDLKMYEALGTPATPFEKVKVYSPSLPGGAGPRSPREDASILRWDLPMVWPYLRYLFPYLSQDEKWQSFSAEFRELKLEASNPREKITTFRELDAWFDECIQKATEVTEDGKATNMGWRSHHVATMRRFRRMLMSLPSRGGGLFSKERAQADLHDIPVRGWSHGQIVVVDLAGLSTDVQALVIARTCERLLDSAEAGELGVEHCALFVDELNAFAPAQGAPEMSAVKKILQKIATQGRYAGISLWGAGQALSRVEPMLVTNAATRALGVTADIELATGTYGRLSAGLSERIATLPKGQMALWHYSFRSALVVRFPRPAWKTGKAKGVRVKKKASDTLSVSSQGLSNLTEGLSKSDVERIISGADSEVEARAELQKQRIPDTRRSRVSVAPIVNVKDPFDLGDDD